MGVQTIDAANFLPGSATTPALADPDASARRKARNAGIGVKLYFNRNFKIQLNYDQTGVRWGGGPGGHRHEDREGRYSTRFRRISLESTRHVFKYHESQKHAVAAPACIFGDGALSPRSRTGSTYPYDPTRELYTGIQRGICQTMEGGRPANKVTIKQSHGGSGQGQGAPP